MEGMEQCMANESDDPWSRFQRALIFLSTASAIHSAASLVGVSGLTELSWLEEGRRVVKVWRFPRRQTLVIPAVRCVGGVCE
jgi:hypothetical protein